MNEMNVLALADTFERIGMDIAPQVAEQAREDFMRPPSSGQLFTIAREIRAAAIEAEQRMRPTLEEAEAVDMPPEIVEKVKAMTDPERRHQEREEEVAAQDAEWERKKTAIMTGPRMTGACTGSGKRVVEREDGTRVCPDCGSEVPDIILPPVVKSHRRRSWQTGEVS